jgi:hypothetical protein
MHERSPDYTDTREYVNLCAAPDDIDRHRAASENAFRELSRPPTFPRRKTRMRKFNKRSAVIAAAAAIAVGGAGAGAYAAGWLVNGDVDAEATVATVVRMDSTLTLRGSIYPGANLDAVLTVTNGNQFPVLIESVANPATNAITVTGRTGCTINNSGLTWSKDQLVGITAAPGKHAYTVSKFAQMSTDVDERCQGAKFAATFVVTGQNA